MKTCHICKETKPLTDYHKSAKRKDGVQTYCKLCMKSRNREYYLSTPEKNELRASSRLKAKNLARELVLSYLQTHACVDCEESDPVVLQFDHVRGSKVMNVSEMVIRGYGTETISEEINKCEVRCANCHIRKTSKQFSWWKHSSRASMVNAAAC